MSYNAVKLNTRYLNIKPTIIDPDLVKLRVWVEDADGNVLWEKIVSCDNNTTVHITGVEA